MLVPTQPKVYHIVHVDRLASIVSDGYLWSDSGMDQTRDTGTAIGISSIKRRRLANVLNSQRDLHVGDCVPFYFCPRSVMLYVIYMSNQYRGRVARDRRSEGRRVRTRRRAVRLSGQPFDVYTTNDSGQSSVGRPHAPLSWRSARPVRNVAGGAQADVPDASGR